MTDLLSIIGLPFRAMPNEKMEAALSVQQKDKMVDRSLSKIWKIRRREEED